MLKKTYYKHVGSLLYDLYTLQPSLYLLLWFWSCRDNTTTSSRNYHISKASDLTKLYNSPVYRVEAMRRPLENLGVTLGPISPSVEWCAPFLYISQPARSSNLGIHWGVLGGYQPTMPINRLDVMWCRIAGDRCRFIRVNLQPPFPVTMWPRHFSCVCKKWHFFRFNERLASCRLANTAAACFRCRSGSARSRWLFHH